MYTYPVQDKEIERQNNYIQKIQICRFPSKTTSCTQIARDENNPSDNSF